MSARVIRLVPRVADAAAADLELRRLRLKASLGARADLDPRGEIARETCRRLLNLLADGRVIVRPAQRRASR